MNLHLKAIRHSVEEVGEGLGLPRVVVTHATNRKGALVVGLVMSKTDVELAHLNTRPRPPGPDDEPVEAPSMTEVLTKRLMEVARARGLPHGRVAVKAKPNGAMVIALVFSEREGEWAHR